MTEQSFELTQEHGDRSRKHYDGLDFSQKKQINNYILKHLYQVSDAPTYLLKCLKKICDSELRVTELGGYDGCQAYKVFQNYSQIRWDNYDFSEIAEYFTVKQLKKYKYCFHLLNQAFTDTVIEGDLFYSSKTLEHFRFREILKILSHTQNFRYQVHVIDWFWRDDTHVVEFNAHPQLIRHLQVLGYKIVDEYFHPERSHIYAMR